MIKKQFKIMCLFLFAQGSYLLASAYYSDRYYGGSVLGSSMLHPVDEGFMRMRVQEQERQKQNQLYAANKKVADDLLVQENEQQFFEFLRNKVLKLRRQIKERIVIVQGNNNADIPLCKLRLKEREFFCALLNRCSNVKPSIIKKVDREITKFKDRLANLQEQMASQEQNQITSPERDQNQIISSKDQRPDLETKTRRMRKVTFADESIFVNS